RTVRIVSWNADLLGIRKIHGDSHIVTLREKHAKLRRRTNRPCPVIGLTALHQTLLQASEADSPAASGQLYLRKIGQLKNGSAYSSPAAMLIEIGDPQLINPYF